MSLLNAPFDVRARIAEANEPRRGEKPTDPDVRPEFAHPTGGFWIDVSTAKETLAGKLELGRVNEEEFALLDHFIDNGFVVLKNAVDHVLIDTILADIDRSLEDGSRMLQSKARRLVADRETIQLPEAKLLDLHMESRAAQAAIFAPRIKRFAELVMDAVPLATQTLTFYYGSTQPVHSDVAFVRVNSANEFVAAWIALEDIEPNSGELVYYPGSHKLPQTLFNGRSVWHQPQSPEAEGWGPKLEAQAQEAGLARTLFRPKKGDALIWHSNLFHGGDARLDAAKTRKSLVAHYCPSFRQPPYMYKREDVSKIRVDLAPAEGYAALGSPPYAYVSGAN